MGSVVKKIAPIAIAVGVGYATGGGFSPQGFSIGGLKSSVGSFFGENLLAKAGLGLQAVGSIQSRKYQKQQSGFQQQQVAEQNKSEAARNRYNNLLQKRQRLTSIRAARVRQGEVQAATGAGGLGVSGTSSAIGAIGATGTQTSANLGNINVAQDVGNQMSGFNIAAANYGSQANSAASKGSMWTNVSTLGGSILTNTDSLENIFKTTETP
jgi:hypothetical protein